MEEDTGGFKNYPDADVALSCPTKWRRPKRRVQSSVDPVCHRLPPEILHTVFLDLAEGDSEGRNPCSASVQVTASHVCRYWRAVALDCPTFWTRLDFRHPTLTEAMLSRSKNAPLTVAFPAFCGLNTKRNSARLGILHTVLSQYVDRLYCVRLDFDYLNIPISPLFSGWNYPPPILQEFTLVGHWMVGVEEEMPVAALLQEAPALLRLNLQLRQTIWTDLPFNQKLTHLELHNAHNTDFSPNTQGFLSSLRQMPHLQMLGLYSALPGVDEYGALPLSLPGLQRLSLIDHTCDIGYFFQILRVPNLATVHLVFSDFEEEEDIADEIYDALQDLQISIGYHPEPRRTVSTVRVWDTSLELCFTPDPQSECSLSNLIISDCFATSNDGQPPVNIHDHLESFKPLFEFATVNALEVEEQNPKAIPEEAWTFLGSLPNLEVVTFNATPLGAFLDTLETKPKPLLGNNPATPYFPALSTLRFMSLELNEEDHQVDMEEFTARLIKILKRRVKRGYPLSELHIETLRHFNEPEVTRLRKAVPSLQVVWDGYETDSSDEDHGDSCSVCSSHSRIARMISVE